jgi:hypothetical protein
MLTLVFEENEPNCDENHHGWIVFEATGVKSRRADFIK